MIRVLIADENALIRKGLREILTEDHDIELIGESSCVDDLFAQIRMNNCDIVISGITIPGKNDIDNIVDIKRIQPTLKIIILTIDPVEEIAKRALLAGASGYLKKDSIPVELIKAVRQVYNGGIYMNSSYSDSTARSVRDNK